MNTANSSKLNSVHIKAPRVATKVDESPIKVKLMTISMSVSMNIRYCSITIYISSTQTLTLSIIAKMRSTRFSGVFSSSGNSTVFPYDISNIIMLHMVFALKQVKIRSLMFGKTYHHLIYGIYNVQHLVSGYVAIIVEII